MTREEKCQYLIDKGYTYDPQTGEVKNPKGKVLKAKSHKGYAIIRLTIFNLKQHQFGWYFIYKEIVDCIDHINTIKDDNRIENLRSVTNQENAYNTKAKGYYWRKDINKYMSYIMVNYKQINLGHFDKEEDARQAYLEAKEKYHKL